MDDITTVEKLQLKEAFAKEDEDFTPWLAGHIGWLAQAVGIPISPETVRTEVTLETLRPDIIAYTDSDGGGEVIIENQYGKSDSYHIGKLLSYAAYEKRAKYAILVTEDAREEHIEAVKALNEKKVCDCNFCLVNAYCYRIAGSPVGISFDVKVGIDPVVVKEVSASKATLSKFWKFFAKRAAEKGVPMYAKRSSGRNTDNWFNGYIGNSSANFVAKVTKSNASVAFWFNASDEATNKENFSTFYQYKEDIDKDFGTGLIWISEDGRKSCKIEYMIDGCGGYGEKEGWQNVADAMLEAVRRMNGVLSKYYELLV